MNYTTHPLNGHQMASVINPVNGYRGQLEAQGKTVKNHMADNKAALRQKQLEFEARQASANAPKGKFE